MKIAIRRGKATTATDADVSGYGVGSAVLDAPEETLAPQPNSQPNPQPERLPTWPSTGPAPAGALQRGFSADPAAQDDAWDSPSSQREPSFAEEAPYMPRRGSGARWRAFRRGLGGKVVLSCIALSLVGAVAIAIAEARLYLLHDERFLLASSAQIQIAGDEHLTRAQILSVFAGDLERNVLRVSLAERRADLERLPWVEHATVMRLLPNRIRVAITERKPVAFVRQGTRIGLVDANGILLDMPPEAAGDPAYSFPVLTGISAADPIATRAARIEVYRRFMQDLDGSSERLSGQVSEVDVSNPEDVRALVASGGTDILVHFGDEQFLSRFKQFQEHLPEWKQQYPKLASADMRYEGQIVLEMQQGAGVPINNASADTSPTTASTDSPSSTSPTAQAEKPAAAPARPAKTKAKVTKKTSPSQAAISKARIAAAASTGVTP